MSSNRPVDDHRLADPEAMKLRLMALVREAVGRELLSPQESAFLVNFLRGQAPNGDEDLAHDPVGMKRLTKDIRAALRQGYLSRQDCVMLVNMYYRLQKFRQRLANQLRAAGAQADPTDLLVWLLGNARAQEADIRTALRLFAENYPISQWTLGDPGVYAVGPVITAGLIAHLNDIPPETVGHWWSFAGLCPGQKLVKGKKRTWNAALKRLLWVFTDVQVKFSTSEPSFYGPLYHQRKAYEVQRNIAGELAGQARETLQMKTWQDDTLARHWYAGCYSAQAASEYWSRKTGRTLSADALETWLAAARGPEGSGQPMLPPGHIDMRARRWLSKLFLSHWHHVAYNLHYQRNPPRPYALAFLDHVHQVPVPNWPMG